MGEYWTRRLEEYGHTGWADPVVYAYDQRERLELFGQLVPETPGSALDVGVGVGDFARLLVRRGWSVTGLDPYVRPTFEHPRFRYLAAPEPIEPVDLAFAITVLSMVTDDSELDALVNWIGQSVRPNGRMLLWEMAGPQPPLPYMRCRSFDEWTQRFAAAGLAFTKSTPTPSPHTNPSVGYTAYRSSLSVRASGAVIRHVPRVPAGQMASRFAKHVLERRALRTLAKHPATFPAASEMSILTFTRE